MTYMKSVRSGAEGNTRLQKQYGGGSTPPRQHYASGGAVKGGGNPSLDEGLSAAGSPAKPSLARPGRKMAGKGGKKDGKKGTNVNVIIMGKGGPDAGAPPMPPMADAGGPPMPPPGGPPMRASGGRVSKSDAAVKIAAKEESRKGGGKVCRSVGGPAMPPRGFDGGAGGARGRLEKIKKYGK